MKKVYLLKTENHHKIGIANDVHKRISQLQTGNSSEIKLVTFYESPYANKIEKALHNRYSYAKKEGEWFTLGIEEEVNFIKYCQQIENNIKFLIENGNEFILNYGNKTLLLY